MKKDINDFITIIRQKNGRIKIKHNRQNEANLYSLLYDIGYRKTKLNNKRVYFYRDKTELIPVKVDIIKDAFMMLLKNSEFSNIPEDIEYSLILNWYYRSNPIKENGLFDFFLNECLNEEETHRLRLKIDFAYKNNYEVRSLISRLEGSEFYKTVDVSGNFHKGDTLYYRKTRNNEYLVLNQIKTKSIDKYYFDSRVAIFNNAKHIGIKEPIFSHSFKRNLSFNEVLELLNTI